MAQILHPPHPSPWECGSSSAGWRAIVRVSRVKGRGLWDTGILWSWESEECEWWGVDGGGEGVEERMTHLKLYNCRVTYSMTNLSLWTALLLLVYILPTQCRRHVDHSSIGRVMWHTKGCFGSLHYCFNTVSYLEHLRTHIPVWPGHIHKWLFLTTVHCILPVEQRWSLLAVWRSHPFGSDNLYSHIIAP